MQYSECMCQGHSCRCAKCHFPARSEKEKQLRIAKGSRDEGLPEQVERRNNPPRFLTR